ncbi:MAG: hypothetical protein L0191_00095 [Acidobacteria bacterium]|nr:hypothetical protein [Acidobacteriota bacterium]
MIHGVRDGVLREVRPLAIHGSPYCDVYFQLAGQPEGQIGSGRIGTESIYAKARSGDRVRLHFVMNLLVRVERAEE